MCTLLNTSPETVYSLADLITHPNTPKKILEPGVVDTGVLQCMSSSGAEFNIKDIVKKAGIKGLEFDAPSNPVVGEAPILDNGLNLLYAPQSYGKSYTAIAIASESGLPCIFIDLESNGKMFVNHCKKNGVAYVYAGGAKDIIDTVKRLVIVTKEKYGRIFVVIDSYSDMFPDDEGKMAQQAQKELGDMHKFFMREVELPILILDHATEQTHQGMPTGFKIEGNKSGKFKKTVAVLRLNQIDGNIENGTFVTVERSRNHDELPVGEKRYYRRNSYLKNKLQLLIQEGKLPEKFKTKDLESVLNGNDREMWRDTRNEIATSDKEKPNGRGKPADFWSLNKREKE